jgi:glycosyltransferase involved in cell wall biosynthesis
MVVTGDRDAVPAVHEPLRQLEHQPDATATAGLAADVIMDERYVHLPAAARIEAAPMRILVFNPSYPPVRCGVGDYTRGLAHALAAAGNEVTVVTGQQVTPAAAGPPRVLPLLRNWDVGGFVRQAWPRVRRLHPDVVVSCFPAVVQGSRSRLLYLLPGLAKGLLGRPRAVFVLHEYIRIGESHRRWLPLALLAADRVVAVTEAERDAVVARYPRLASKIVVRHNPPNVPIAPDDPAADAAMRANLGPADRPLLAYFGFIWDPKKGFEELLGALALTEAMLVVSGSLDPENAYHAHIASEIARLDLEDRVRWLGYLDEAEIGRLLRAADAVVLPFRGGAESGFTSLLAALVNGAVVITTQGPRNPPWLRDGETAQLVPERDTEAIAAAIVRLASDAALAVRLRAGARALSFGWDELVEAVTGQQP